MGSLYQLRLPGKRSSQGVNDVGAWLFQVRNRDRQRMDEYKEKRLTAKGWKVSNADEFRDCSKDTGFIQPVHDGVR